MVPAQRAAPATSPFARALASCRAALGAAALFSGVVNLLMLTGSIYMLQVYDRVLASHSVPTLLAISALAMFAFALQGCLDAFRARLLVRIAERVDAEVAPAAFELLARRPLLSAPGLAEPLQPLRDLEVLRGFVAGHGPTALFDLPWLPIYVGFAFLLHPWLGWFAIAATGVLLVLTIVTEFATRAPAKAHAAALSERNAIADGAQRGADALAAMGMRPSIGARFSRANERALAAQRAVNDAAATHGSLARSLRFVMQSGVLGLGAYAAMLGQLSPGAMIAGSILIARALAPIDVAIASWKGFVAAREGYHRLVRALGSLPQAPERLELPAPRRELAVEGLAVAAPGTDRPIVTRVEFKVEAGSAVAIIGPSAAGKSTLARAIVGALPPLRGRVVLDGARLDLWNEAALGRAIGFLPQDVQLFDGNVAENVARFDPAPDARAVIAAAELAGFHDHILRLPNGYETRIGPAGYALSAGQRQRLGLARALYRDPFLIVLDEPNANLDAEGEAAVSAAIRAARARGGIAIVVAHRPSALAEVDKVLVMREGAQAAFGPKDEVLGRALANVSRIARPAGLKSAPAE